ncbi:unnamed protein product, partial [Onchocerca flexuosa]|uniref:TlyA family rRNA (Cytidine-2'-O)-methyltransferase n=1 Tax=Onchocerca flexuosa TaxID=387005 RepID=A0A183HS48_9BILA
TTTITSTVQLRSLSKDNFHRKLKNEIGGVGLRNEAKLIPRAERSDQLLAMYSLK